jgi:hypothetical protein
MAARLEVSIAAMPEGKLARLLDLLDEAGK